MDNMPGNNNNNNQRPGAPGGGNRRARDIGFYALILVILLAAVFSLTNSSQTVELSYSEIIDLFQDARRWNPSLSSGNELQLYLREPYEGLTDRQ